MHIQGNTLSARCLLACTVGLLAGSLTLLFRFLVEFLQACYLPDAQVGNYEALSPWAHFLLPLVGAFGLAWIFHKVPAEYCRVGIVHVILHLQHHKARLPWQNMLVQFFGGILAIISGQSVDREGPAVHLGAASSSLMGQALGQSRATLRILVACGTASAIAAAFNTPLAGVLFALEVVLLEFKLSSLLPVVIASVVGALLSQSFYGPEPAFSVPPTELHSLQELPLFILLGGFAGLVAVSFKNICLWSARTSQTWSVWWRFPLAGLLTGLCALLAPQIMGVSYDTIGHMLGGEMALGLIALVLCAKLLSTACAVGLGIPGGLIGPTLMMGAATGYLCGALAPLLFAETASPTFYALVGMGVMMGAVLQAPMAALIALLELTANPNILLPAMLALVIAILISSELFGKRSIFLMLAALATEKTTQTKK